MAYIADIRHRRIYNSHVLPTTEFTILLDDGRAGRGASPQGETIGIYERHGTLLDTPAVLDALRADGMLAAEVTQTSLDAYLRDRTDAFGKNTCYALSLALHEALTEGERAEGEALEAPRLAVNILNGGRHAYTNPVLSDFSEYLLVAKTDDLGAVLEAHGAIQEAVHDALLTCEKAVVNGNPVNVVGARDNRACIEFLLGVTERLGLSDAFDLMIDAAAAGLRADTGYALEVTDGSVRDREAFAEYWAELIRAYPLRYLEDPFAERDGAAWTTLSTVQDTCALIGDDLYASDAARIAAGTAAGWTDGVIIKPNQAGSVTAVRSAVEAAQAAGQIVIVSHRSVSTETPFESVLSCELGADLIKIGPLLTDYSSVVRLNEIIRLTETD